MGFKAAVNYTREGLMLLITPLYIIKTGVYFIEEIQILNKLSFVVRQCECDVTYVTKEEI